MLSPLATPTKRAASRGRRLSPGGLSPGGLGRRIHDWQRTANHSPGGTIQEDIRSPRTEDGAEDDDDEDYDDFDQSRLENEPIVPKMLPELRTPEHQTPLPKLPIVVLAIW
jgi:hypothetical protein